MVTSIDKNTALILIDLQKSVVRLTLASPVQNILENASKLVDAFHMAGLPVVIVNVNPRGAKWTSSRRDAKPPQIPPSPDFLEITPEIKTRSGDIFITKHTWGAFFETGLDDELKKRNITGIVIAGVSTSIGVEGTARQASERGYNITFASDAMTDMVAEAHERSIKYIFPRMGEVDGTEKIIEKLN
jgi:nicotinamidase-related amidase